MKTKIIPIVCAAVVSMAGVSSAGARTNPDPAAVATDALLGRPIGLVATVLGSAVFVVSLPFSALSGSIGSAAHSLVVVPAKDTFARPLGDLHYKHPGPGYMTVKQGKQQHQKKAAVKPN